MSQQGRGGRDSFNVGGDYTGGDNARRDIKKSNKFKFSLPIGILALTGAVTIGGATTIAVRNILYPQAPNNNPSLSPSGEVTVPSPSTTVQTQPSSSATPQTSSAVSTQSDPNNNAAKDQLLQTKKCSGCDLSGVDLEKADLKGADLSGANLSKANLSNASLADAKLHGANLENARLDGSELINADLSNANLRGAGFGSANLSYANLNSSDLRGASFLIAKLNNANLQKVDARSADFRSASLKNTNFNGADLSNAGLSVGSDALEAANFSNTDLRINHGISFDDLQKVKGINLCGAKLLGNVTSQKGC